MSDGNLVCDVWLAVLDAVPAPAAISAFWNWKENDVLDSVPEADCLWIGRTDAMAEYPFPGSAGGVGDLLFLVGTLPEYTAPQITDELIERLTVAFTAAADPTLPAISVTEFVAFLVANEGRYLLDTDSPVGTDRWDEPAP
ncbi:hypothetical protein I6A60_37925 [Frankia sp. AgB1.9]|uniref:hypothetical protein n=1 Tax=unclassified Frankia TaxID=2632575 RepID=UPI00193288A7|nr:MULTISPECIES: hypothetical protein [unclassified Frankia]MBL7494333.1 hypothetical protein [Frankia sp. AgW1.1]MBL7553574.1 hypothetical protein [Frankia sp. AgB1.9]MBL7622234.1 hypothetical protein [Frankia sp. AgB1.8]